MADDLKQLLSDWANLGIALGLDQEYFLDLLQDRNDWSLIIKCSAVAETAINRALAVGLAPPVAAYITRQNVSPKRDLARALELRFET